MKLLTTLKAFAERVEKRGGLTGDEVKQLIESTRNHENLRVEDTGSAYEVSDIHLGVFAVFYKTKENTWHIKFYPGKLLQESMEPHEKLCFMINESDGAENNRLAEKFIQHITTSKAEDHPLLEDTALKHVPGKSLEVYSVHQETKKERLMMRIYKNAENNRWVAENHE